MARKNSAGGAKRTKRAPDKTLDTLIRNLSSLFLHNDLPLLLKWVMLFILFLPLTISILGMLKLITANTNYELEFFLRFKATNHRKDPLDRELEKLLEKNTKEVSNS